MSVHGRPSVDVEAVLDADEWRELFAERLRLGGFWARMGGAAAAVVVGAVTAVALGAGLAPAGGAAAALLTALAAFTVGFALAGPRLRWPHVSAPELTVHWRVLSDRIEADRAGDAFRLVWNDIDQVVVTRRLVVLRLGERRGVLGLPRRVATPLGESLITNWAEDSGAEVIHRRGASSAPSM